MNEFNIGIVVFCLIILVGIGTYIKKLLNKNRTKDISIIGLKEIIRLLEKKIK